MSDIDFDELDRAVNGAIDGNGTPAPRPRFDDAPVAPQQPAVPQPQTVTRVERTTLSPVSSGPTAVAVSAPSQSTAPAARRSSGRFMDMVHPSSDMRSHVPNTPIETKPVPQAPVVVPEPVIVEAIESPAWNEPLESPFLPDAKVEKRPLGGGEANVAEATSIVDEFDFQGLLDEPEEPLLEAPEPQERLEATTMPDPIDFAVAQTENEVVDAETVVTDEPIKAEEEPVVTPEVIVQQPVPIAEAPRPVVEEHVGPTSITPQYKEQASSNQQSGAMYDTESYHQAVAAPAKKKSGWLTVLMILLLVILGAVGGWAVFTYVLPML